MKAKCMLKVYKEKKFKINTANVGINPYFNDVDFVRTPYR